MIILSIGISSKSCLAPSKEEGDMLLTHAIVVIGM